MDSRQSLGQVGQKLFLGKAFVLPIEHQQGSVVSGGTLELKSFFKRATVRTTCAALIGILLPIKFTVFSPYQYLLSIKVLALDPSFFQPGQLLSLILYLRTFLHQSRRVGLE